APGSYPDSLAGGRTLRGSYAVSGVATLVDQPFETAVSFALALASAPAAHLVVGGAATAECPGSAAAPAAAAGHLCGYEAEPSGLIKSRAIFDPAQGDAAGAGQSGRFGFGVRIVADGAGPLGSQGSWAVTAP